MAFPTGWTRSCKLTIQHGQVPADQTAFPVLVTAACLPDEMVTSGGGNSAQADGGDIRFSSDSAGTTQLACEVVTFTQDAVPASATAEIWVPVDILTAADVDIYVWYAAGGGLSQPAVGASFGAQAVWDANYLGVWHMQASGGTALTDSTSHAQTSTKKGATEPNPSAGKIGNGQDFDGVDDIVTVTAAAGLLNSDTFTVSAWVRPDVLPASDSNYVHEAISTQDDAAINGWWLGLGAFNNSAVAAKVTLEFRGSGVWRSNTGGSTLSVGTSYLIGATYDQSNLRIYLNGASDATAVSTSDAIVNATGLKFGRRSNTVGDASDRYWDGLIDEVRISGIARSANWLLTEYRGQNAPTSFVVAGTPSGVGGGGGVTSHFRRTFLGTRAGSRQMAA